MCKDCDCIKCKEYFEKQKEQIKIKNAENYKKKRDVLIKKVKEYQELHKEEINKKRYERVVCDCGGHYQVCNKLVHMKTKKHKEYEKTKGL